MFDTTDLKNNPDKKYGFFNLSLIILMIILILTSCHRNNLIAERTESFKELTHETKNLTKQREKTNDLLIEQNVLLRGVD